MLTHFAAQVRTDGATAIVLIFPGEGEIAAQRDGRVRSYSTLLEALEQRGIAVSDLTDVLGNGASQHSLGEIVQGHYRPWEIGWWLRR